MTTAPTTSRSLHNEMLLDDDKYDRQLLEQVHPPAWRDPEPRERYHLVVIGAGTAGLVTAAAAAGLGARVALVERNLMGGDCLNVGCVPSKAVIRAARAWREGRDAQARFGAPAVADGDDGDFAAAMRRMRRLRATLSPVDSAARFRDLGVDVFLGDGRFVADDAVEVNGKRLAFRRAVIASGARAAVPPIAGLDRSGCHTNETIFTLTTRPGALVVLGGGPIGCELAQAFARLGTRVTMINQDARILPREDADASAVVQAAMERDGVTILNSAQARRVDRSDGVEIHVQRSDGDTTVSGDTLLVATGRTPNVNGLGLDDANVRYDEKQGISVDDRLRTTNSRIYAVGDACSALKFTHAADFQARLVVQNALFFGRGRASALVTPWVTFTSPEVAHVGITEAEAKERNVAVDVITVQMHDVDRATLDDEREGFCKIVLARGTDRILGATLVSEHAGETIGEVALAMTAGLGLGAIGKTMHPYPTQAEVLRKAADAWRRRKLTPVVKRLFAGYFRLLG